MESKFVIFVVLAALTRSAFALPSTAYGLSEEKTAILNRITQNQEATAAANFAAVNPIFDIIDKLTAMRDYDLKLKNDDLASIFATALSTAKKATDYTMDSSPLIAGRNCSAVETARTAVHAHLENSYTIIAAAIQLARSGNYSEHRAEIANSSIASQQALEGVIGNVYEAIRTCVNTTDANELATINAAEIGTADAIRCANTAVFNAIKVFAAGIPARNKDLAVISDTQVTRNQALVGMRTIVETIFSPMKSLYINAQLGQTGIASSLRASQYTQMVSSTKYKEAIGSIFDIIKSHLKRLRLGLSNACNNDPAKLDASQAETLANFEAGFGTFLDSVLLNEPTPSSATAGDREYINTFLKNVIAGYYKSLKYALGQEASYAEALGKIEALRIEAQAALPQFVRSIYHAIQNSRSSPDDVAADITAFKDVAFVQARNFVDCVYQGISVLTKACYRIEVVSEGDFATVQSAQNGTGSLIENFTSNIATADVSLIQANNLLNIGVRVNVGSGIGLGLGLGLNL